MRLINIYICVCIFKSIYIWNIFINIYICVCICIYIWNIFKYIYICVCICIYIWNVFKYIYICVCICIYIWNILSWTLDSGSAWNMTIYLHGQHRQRMQGKTFKRKSTRLSTKDETVETTVWNVYFLFPYIHDSMHLLICSCLCIIIK